MRFSVGEIAGLLDLTPSALRFFEKENIITPNRTQGGQRYYSLEDLARLISSKKYSSMGVPIKAIAGQFQSNGDSRNTISARLRKKAEAASEKSKYYLLLSKMIQEQADELDEVDTNLNKVSLCLRPEYYVLTDPHYQLISRDKKRLDLMGRWIKGIPATKLTYLSLNNYQDDRGTLGYIITAKHARELDIPVSDPAILHVPESLCTRTIELKRSAPDLHEKIFVNINHYTKKAQLMVSGVSLAVFIVVESGIQDVFNIYLDITVPIRLQP